MVIDINAEICVHVSDWLHSKSADILTQRPQATSIENISVTLVPKCLLSVVKKKGDIIMANMQLLEFLYIIAIKKTSQYLQK